MCIISLQIRNNTLILDLAIFHMLRGIPYSQALRLRKICDSDYVYQTRVNYLKSFLLKRGYKRDFIDNQIGLVKNVDHFSLLEGKGIRDSEGSSRMLLNLDSHPALLDVHRILRELQVFTDISPLLKRVLPEVPMVNFRRPTNLKDNLVRAKIQPLEEKVKEMFCCGKARCKVCHVVETGPTFVGGVEKRSFHINHAFD